mmetsp:Transcript_50656/g.99206  ORF Transcript_50656/g.99206 Transcript_50656/m.99206 type:complete len:389 (+) Transcript_50656:1-1167(+)
MWFTVSRRAACIFGVNHPKHSSFPFVICRHFSYTTDFKSNITDGIAEKVGRNLHLQKSHPLFIIKSKIEDHFKATDPSFRTFDDMSPYVTTTACFDELLVAPDHISRAATDTFYKEPDIVLRTHTSAHQTDLLRKGHTAFLATGDCYRRDEIDSSHYPVFHQMEGVRVWPKEDISDEAVMDHLTASLEGMVDSIFGKVEKRWVDAYFPFTDPSLELEVFYNNEWLEVLGSGMIQAGVMEKAGLESTRKGWAFGIGLERLAMVLFKIPDIRLFWSTDKRFLSQFESGDIVEFKEFSKYPPCFKDVSFWLDDKEAMHPNDFYAIVRDSAGDLVEHVEVVDEFTHPKTGRFSRCYRVTYRSLEKTLTNDNINELYFSLRSELSKVPGVKLR